MFKLKAPGVDVVKVLELLSQGLQIEYSMISQYTQFAEMIHNEEIKRRVLALGIASTKHADVVSKAIIKLGGTPNWSFEYMQRDIGYLNFFEIQLEKEKIALELHLQAAEIIQDSSLKQEFTQLAEEEKKHIKTVENIIAVLI